jgi:LPS sulfotransferase NodH
VRATPRSGGTLLCRALNQTGVAGHPEEYFEALRHSGRPRRPHEYFDPARHANIIERLAFREMPDVAPSRNPLWNRDRHGRYLEWALDAGTTTNGVFGAKLMWGYLGDFATLLRDIEGLAALPIPELLARVFPGVRYVQTTREDKVRQAVSLWKAVQTQTWEREQGEAAANASEPVFSFRAINYLVRLLTAHDASRDAYFLGLGIEPLKLTYEELACSTRAAVEHVLEYLEIALPHCTSPRAPGSRPRPTPSPSTLGRPGPSPPRRTRAIRRSGLGSRASPGRVSHSGRLDGRDAA